MIGCSEDNLLEQERSVRDKGTFTDERDGTVYGWVNYGNLEWTPEIWRYSTDFDRCFIMFAPLIR